MISIDFFGQFLRDLEYSAKICFLDRLDRVSKNSEWEDPKVHSKGNGSEDAKAGIGVGIRSVNRWLNTYRKLPNYSNHERDVCVAL